MFSVNDLELEQNQQRCRKLETTMRCTSMCSTWARTENPEGKWGVPLRGHNRAHSGPCEGDDSSGGELETRVAREPQ